jgi:hypothetical protein
MGTGAHEVGRLDGGLIGSVEARGADWLGQMRGLRSMRGCVRFDRRVGVRARAPLDRCARGWFGSVGWLV